MQDLSHSHLEAYSAGVHEFCGLQACPFLALGRDPLQAFSKIAKGSRDGVFTATHAGGMAAPAKVKPWPLPFECPPKSSITMAILSVSHTCPCLGKPFVEGSTSKPALLSFSCGKPAALPPDMCLLLAHGPLLIAQKSYYLFSMHLDP